MLGDGKSKINWPETSGMQYVDCGKVFCLTRLQWKSSLVVVTSVPIPKKS